MIVVTICIIHTIYYTRLIDFRTFLGATVQILVVLLLVNLKERELLCCCN